MCDPISLVVGAVGGMAVSKALTPKQQQQQQAAATDPAVERANAEAEAAQRANQRLATDQRRRREQGNLLARGAPSFGLGDQAQDPASASPIGSSFRPGAARPAMGVAPSQTLISRGSPSYGGGGGGGGRNTMALQ